MPSSMDWKSAIALSCSLAAVLIAVALNVRKKRAIENSRKKKPLEGTKSNGIKVDWRKVDDQATEDETIAELPDPRWVKVAKVEELFLYPLKSGRAKRINDCRFTEYGICAGNSGKLSLRDRMFLAYNEETGHFQTGRNYPTLLLVNVTAVDEFKVKLEAVGMPSIVFTVPTGSDDDGLMLVDCTMWYSDPVKCIDCGPEAAKWISEFLTGTSNGVRLGCAIPERRNVLEGPFKRYAKVYEKLRNEDSGLFSDLASYMLLSTKSLEDLNSRLEKPVPACQFRPNILVSGQDPFEEDKWEWIKIGDRVVIRNIKPCTRCSMVRIDPETAKPSTEEPLKTLHTYRELTDPKQKALEGTAPAMGIYCGLYISGKVQVGDDVFVHMPDNSVSSST